MVPTRLLAYGWRLRAQHARKQGHYTQRVLREYRRVWQLSGRIEDLLACIVYRRDLGQLMPARWEHELHQGMAALPLEKYQLAMALLLEKRGICPSRLVLPPLLDALPPAVLHCCAEAQMPILNVRQQQLYAVYQQQAVWREAFTAVLRKALDSGGICVTGNAGCMVGSGLGSTVDRHACVVRFNRFAADDLSTADSGRRLDVWVRNPGRDVPAVSGADWIVLTGPEVQFRVFDWSGLEPQLAARVPIITLPLAVWRDLVVRLQAPPSAGIALLALLNNLLGSWQGITVAGFGALCEAGRPYHTTSRYHRASGRHNWQKEAELLNDWLGAGLVSLHA